MQPPNTSNNSKKPNTKPKPMEKQEAKPSQRKQQQQPKKRVYVQKTEDADPCLVCSQTVKARDSVWSCRRCYKEMHLDCIKKWIFNINDKKKVKSIFNWSCPQCKFEYAEALPEYYCYCGKYRNPELEHDVAPHSCGKYCQKQRGLHCPHPCPDLCHPGKCKPCTYQGIEIRCCCGKATMSIKCSDEREYFLCDQKCDKLLDCKKHNCTKNCHTGSCRPCTYKYMGTCFCGKNQDVIDCKLDGYSCKEKCGRTLDCGEHKCQKTCHEGGCSPCQRKPQMIKKCPCGAYDLLYLATSERTKCTDPIPLCGMPCKKKLPCGHNCTKSCHEGPCSQCKVQVTQKCRCQSATRKAECWELEDPDRVLFCEKVCKHRKACGQHFCAQVCCQYRNSDAAADHPCNLTCQRMLDCGKHNCGMACHSTNCGKCPVLYSQPQPCPCGRTSLRPPVSCGTVVPQCDNACQKVMQCGHICKLNCHYGKCQCGQRVKIPCQCQKNLIQTQCGRQGLCHDRCDKVLPCGHKCQVQCHGGPCPASDGSCTKVCNKKRETCSHFCMEKCHPASACSDHKCTVEVLIKCQCGHRQKMVACGSGSKHLQKHISCNKVCENVKRFGQLYKQKEVYYPSHLIYFGMRNFKYLQRLEEKIQQFIRSEEPSLHVEFKFPGDGKTKIILHTLFEKHYHLEADYYPNRKAPFFTLTQTKNTMLPVPNLSKYITQIREGGEAKKAKVPFQASLRFTQLSKQKMDAVENGLHEFKHSFYSERKDKMQYIHFWIKEVAEQAYEVVKAEFPFYVCNLEYNAQVLDQAEQVIGAEQIIEEEVDADQVQTQVREQPSTKVEQVVVKQTKEDEPTSQVTAAKEKRGIQIPVIQRAQNPQTKAQPSKAPVFKPAGINIEKKNPAQLFKKKVYPPSSEFVQDIYDLDQDELQEGQVDWEEYIQKLTAKELGMEASEWRVRALLILAATKGIGETQLWERLDKLISWYNDQKSRARRMLAIRNVETKNVADFLHQNDVFISTHEPEFAALNQLLNQLRNKRSEAGEVPDELWECNQVQVMNKHLSAIRDKKPQSYFKTLSTCDYVTACSLLFFLDKMRKICLAEFAKGRKETQLNQLADLLFFDQPQLCSIYLKNNGYDIDYRKVPKHQSDSEDESSSKHEGLKMVLVKLPASEQQTQEQQSLKTFENNFNGCQRLLKQKRDVKYAMEQVGELLDDKYLYKSHFAFGDHKPQDDGYLFRLAKELRRKT